MSKFMFTSEGKAVSDDPNDDIVADLDATMDELLKLDAEDAFITADTGSNAIYVEFVVEAETIDAAMAKGATTLRSALHAAGIGTPGWDSTPASRKSVEVTSRSSKLVTA